MGNMAAQLQNKMKEGGFTGNPAGQAPIEAAPAGGFISPMIQAGAPQIGPAQNPAINPKFGGMSGAFGKLLGKTGPGNMGATRPVRNQGGFMAGPARGAKKAFGGM